MGLNAIDEDGYGFHTLHRQIPNHSYGSITQ